MEVLAEVRGEKKRELAKMCWKELKKKGRVGKVQSK